MRLTFLMLLKSIIFAVVVLAVMYAVRIFFGTNNFISDAGSAGPFASIYGTLYGIIMALVILEVWTQFNKTSTKVDDEAAGLEKLFRLAKYLRDKPLEEKMKKTIKKYIGWIVGNNFKNVSAGLRETEGGTIFREIASILKNIKFDDDHDAIVFAEMIRQYGNLSETRTERLNLSLTRLPLALKALLYVSSLLAILYLISLPFANMYYGFITAGAMAIIIFMAFQVVEDLDNPFVGQWCISTEPFKRALKHIEEDY